MGDHPAIATQDPTQSRPPATDATDVLGRRIGAALLDIIVLAVIFFVVGLASGGGHAGNGHASVRLGGGATLAFLAVVLAYYYLGEAITGQTLGKRLLGVRVTAVGGGRAGAGAIALRTLLRIIDSIPAMYLLGLIVILATGERRARLGDLAAGTAVVRAERSR